MEYMYIDDLFFLGAKLVIHNGTMEFWFLVF
jgi:hypothetical protein